MGKKKQQEAVLHPQKSYPEKTAHICLLAFAVPFLIVAIAFAVMKIYPFGNR